MTPKTPRDRLAYQKAFYLANREKRLAYVKEYRLENPDKIAAGRLMRRIKHPAKVLWASARKRAKETGRDFAIEVSDIQMPTHCPVLGIELKSTPGHADREASPSLDRIDNSKGYVKGNIVVVSYRANRIKNDATLAELRAVLEFYTAMEAWA